MDINNIIFHILVAGIPLIFAITIHEAAHAYVAKWLGDKTAYNLGRTTLNPVPHIDPVGTVALPLLMVLLHFPIIFGWAKPVPINYNNFKNFRRDVALVAFAGPFANIIMAIVWVLAFSLLGHYPYIQAMAIYGVMINVVLFVFNLLPIPPLDGSRIVSSFLSPQAAYKYNSIERYGFFIIIALIMIPIGNSNILSILVNPILHFIFGLIS